MRTPLLLALAVATLGAMAGPARAQSPAAAPWDSRGWVMLGEQTVNGKVDTDKIKVGKYEGTFSKVTVVVLDSDLEMIDMKIKFVDRTEYHPEVKQVFKEGQRTRVLDLPPSEPLIQYIEFKYKNLPGGGRAKVQVWGWKTGSVAPPPAPAPAPPPAPPPPPAWDAAGWTLLGERTVNGRYDHDRIEVGRYQGKFTKLALVVVDSDLELIDLSVKFGKGAPWHPELKHYFKEGQRSRVIDFPGDERTIKFVEMKYRNLPGGGRAKVQVFGRAEAPAAPPAPPPAPKPFSWDAKGWVMLGERVVNGHGREDTDKIEVSRAEGKFKKLTLVVLDSDLEMIDFIIKFGRGEPYHPEVKALFKEDTRARVIDLPGDERVIKWIEFKYRNLPGGGKARVQVWAK